LVEKYKEELEIEAYASNIDPITYIDDIDDADIPF
jgi:hypothetical protein